MNVTVASNFKISISTLQRSVQSPQRSNIFIKSLLWQLDDSIDIWYSVLRIMRMSFGYIALYVCALMISFQPWKGHPPDIYHSKCWIFFKVYFHSILINFVWRIHAVGNCHGTRYPIKRMLSCIVIPHKSGFLNYPFPHWDLQYLCSYGFLQGPHYCCYYFFLRETWWWPSISSPTPLWIRTQW